MNLANVPSALRERAQWVCWRYEDRGNGKKPTKIPINAHTGRNASSANPATWSTFEIAAAAAVHHAHAGIGYVLTSDDPFFGVDLDGCITAGGGLREDADDIVTRLATYTEISPSGQGLRAIGTGSLPGPGRCDRKAGREIYDRDRFLTITGEAWNGYRDIRACNGECDSIYSAYWTPRAASGTPLAFGDVSGELEALDLPAQTVALIATMDGIEDYHGDRSAAAFAAAMSMVYHNVSLDSICSILTDPRYQLAGAALERRHGDVGSAREWVRKYVAEPAAYEVGEERYLELRVGENSVIWPQPTVRGSLPPSAEEFASLAFPPMDPILGPFCRQQSTLCYAVAGAGKTMLALSIAAAMADGRDFGGWRSHGPVRVLYIDGEMAGVEVQERLAAVRSPNLFIANIVNWGAGQNIPQLNLATPEGRRLVDSWADALDVDYVFIDNVMSTVAVPGVSVNSDEFWSPVERFLMTQRSKNRGVFMIDHANQSGGVHGTKTKTWRVNYTISVTPEGVEEHPDGLTLTVPRQRIQVEFEKVRGTLSVSMEKHCGRFLTIRPIGQDWPAEKATDIVKRKARELVELGMKYKDIAEELGISQGTISKWKKKGWK